MPLTSRLIDALARRPGRAVPAPEHMLPPGGRRRSWVHYGVMLPGLPDPHRAFGVMAILGTPGVALFDNPAYVTTTPGDTAYVVSATSSMTGGQFAAYSMREDCDLAPDGSRLRFGADLTLECRHPHYRVRRTHPDVEVELEITATDVATQFVRLPGVYDHWSLLARAEGTITPASGPAVDIGGLCTVEYARGVGLHSLTDRELGVVIPAGFFTYQVLDVDDSTQLLLSHALGPGGLPIQHAVHERTVDGARTYRHGLEFEVYGREPRATPDGRTMALPTEFGWSVDGGDGRPVARIEATARGDWAYGLGAGFVGTYDYTGEHRGKPIEGRAYVEYIDLRSPAGETGLSAARTRSCSTRTSVRRARPRPA